MHNSLFIFILVLNILYTGFMAWNIRAYALGAFVLYKLIPAVCCLASVLFLLNILGFIVVR